MPSYCLAPRTISPYHYGMKVFWWQGGLHAEPETDAERTALEVLWKGIRKTSLSEDNCAARVVSAQPGVPQENSELGHVKP